jgi:hypothetical protein
MGLGLFSQEQVLIEHALLVNVCESRVLCMAAFLGFHSSACPALPF